MKNEYLRAFVIGSSFCVFVLFFYAVRNFEPNKWNYDYASYTFMAPLFLGLANVVSLFISNYFHLLPRMRFLIMSLLAPTLVLLFVIYNKVYNYTTTSEWIRHIIGVYLAYFIVFNVILYLLDKYV